MKKIKAFTLLELLIGMIISSIVISLGYMTYFIVYKQYVNYKETRETISHIMQMKTVLTDDFSTAHTIISPLKDQLKLNNEKGIAAVEYDFSARYITRKEGAEIDTFHLISSEYVPLYVDPTKNEYLPLITGFSFDAMVLGEKEHFVFTKQYAADVMINKEP